MLHKEYMHHNAIPQREALVLFHYMTRSFQDFRERKLSRYRAPLPPVDPATHTLHTSRRTTLFSTQCLCIIVGMTLYLITFSATLPRITDDQNIRVHAYFRATSEKLK